MTDGDADDDARVPQPRPEGLAEAVPITSRGATRSRSGGTAVLDGLAPPWLRMPAAGSERLSSHPQVRPVTLLASRRSALVTAAEPPLGARPRIVEEPSILGLSRRTRSRIGSRLFTLFFVAVFTLIAVQMMVEILSG